MKRVIMCTKSYLDRPKGSGVIKVSKLNFWTGGGAVELVLETPKLVRSLLVTISRSVPNFIIFPCSLHRAGIVIDCFCSKILPKTIANIAASSDTGAKPWRAVARATSGTKQNGQNGTSIGSTWPTPDSIPHPLGSGTGALAKCATLVDTQFARHRREVKVWELTLKSPK